MKKFKSLVLAVIGLLCSMSVSAHDFEVDGIYYNVTSSTERTVTVTYKGENYYSFEEYNGSVVIPELVAYNGNSYSVTSIGEYAFSQCYDLISVEIPNSVTSIGFCAFSFCIGLTSVKIPNSITSIGSAAFGYCASLTSVEIPNSVTFIGDDAFASSGITSVKIPNSITSIEGWVFRYCASLTFVEIPNSVTSIGPHAFWGCGLTSVEIPSSVISIGDEAFAYCSLTSITSLISEEKLFAISVEVFKNIDHSTCILYVPYGAKDTYASTQGWSEFANIVEMDPTEFNLTISEAGYATLYLDYATEIPEGVEVYTAKEVDGIWLKIAQVEDIIPANTAVIVKAPAGTYTFVQTATETPAIDDNLLKGSAEDAYIDVPSNRTAFVLSMVDGEVGMYLAKLTDGRFLNNANKAYLLLDNNKLGLSDEELDTSVGGAQLSLRFNFGDATSIDDLSTEPKLNNVVYDLYGRKLNSITTPGLYIVNGKKVLVK